MPGKVFQRVRNDLVAMDIVGALPCGQQKECVAAGGSCDHFVSHECPVAGSAVFLPDFTKCPFLGNVSFEQMMATYCHACRACEGKKPDKICAVCRSLYIDGQWSAQKFIGIQTAIPYVFCGACRIQSQ